MTLRTPPLYLQAGSHSAENDRLGISGLVGTAGVGPGAAELQVTQSATPAMTVAVAAGHVWVAGTTSSTQGTYHTYNDAAVTLTVTTAHASLPRIDLVCMTIRDAAYAGSSNDCILQVIAGTPAASPTAPALPASSLSLATIAVAAGASSIVNANITDTRTRAAANLGGAWGTIGGTLSNQTDLNNALAAKATYLRQTATPTGAYNTIWEDTNTTPSVLMIWNGSAWVSFSGAAILTAADVSSTTGSPTISTYTSGGIGYTVYKFTGSGSITLGKAGLCDILAVGGGGGGSSAQNAAGSGGAGGGAGGVLSVSNAYLPSGANTVVIGGGGGAGSSTAQQPGYSGYTSRVGPFYAVGGGGGAPVESGNAMTGGSGGGASSSVCLAATGTSGQGNSGGTGTGSFVGNGAGGGGGAGAVGGNGDATGGAGGDGVTSTIADGSTATYYGGGGGGMGTSSGGAGGQGGGGAGGTNGTAGTANLGGGGGGAKTTAAAGGSGVVFVRVRS